MFDAYLDRWTLTRDGDPIATHSSDLLPVRRGGMPAMLKTAREDEERCGPDLMLWWDGDGAARVLEREGDAVLLERAMGHRSLVDMARTGADDAASRVLCDVAARLHAPRERRLPKLIPLERWFDDLWPGAAEHGGILGQAANRPRSARSAARGRRAAR